MIWRCVQCMGTQNVSQVDITTLGQPRSWIWGQHDPCVWCGNESRPLQWWSVVYAMPIRVVMPSMVVARLIHEGDEIELHPLPVVDVWAGPHADKPIPPTPAQILQAAGIEPPATWLDDLE